MQERKLFNVNFLSSKSSRVVEKVDLKINYVIDFPVVKTINV